MRNIFLFLGVLAISIASWAQAETRPEILVFGTYHMSNPGHDIHNMQADDVLSPQRQKEIAQLIEVLKRFHRTKIAIEAMSGANQWSESIPTTARESTLGLARDQETKWYATACTIQAIHMATLNRSLKLTRCLLFSTS